MSESAHINMPRAGDIWRHHGGRTYLIVGTGIDTETGSAVVVYQNAHWDNPPLLYSRRFDVFLGFTEDKKRRFECLQPGPYGSPK